MGANPRIQRSESSITGTGTPVTLLHDTELTFRLSRGYIVKQMPPPTTAETRPLPADARRNREAIVKAARKVFSTQGQDAQMDDIARRAKVGVGTVYRHFPTKEALLEELVRESFRELADMWLEALERPDPWDAFVDVMW